MSKKYSKSCICCDPPITFDNKQGLYYHKSKMSSTKKREVASSSKCVAKHPCYDIVIGIAKTVTESDTLMSNDPSQFINAEMTSKLKAIDPAELWSIDRMESILEEEVFQLIDSDLMTRIGSVTNPVFRQTKKNIITSADDGLKLFEARAKAKQADLRTNHLQRREMLEAELREESELLDLEIAMIAYEPRRRGSLKAVNVLELIGEAYPQVYRNLAPKKRQASSLYASQNQNEDFHCQDLGDFGDDINGIDE
jgi:hypothetical protein